MAENMELLTRSWNVITNTLTPGKTTPISPGTEVEFINAIQVMCENDLGHLVKEWFQECVQQDLRQRVAPEFWSHFDNIDGDNASKHLASAVEFLHDVFSEYTPCMKKMEAVCPQRATETLNAYPTELSDLIIIYFKAIIFYAVPQNFLEIVDSFYSQAFKVFHHTSTTDMEDEGDEEDGTHCSGCAEETEQCKCQAIMDSFHNVNRMLDEIGILERISGGAVTKIVHQRIQHHVENTCKGTSKLYTSRQCRESWLENKVIGWLNLVYTTNPSHVDTDSISGFKGRLLHFLYETFARTQIEQLFNIIIEFPESEPAILDLKFCLEKTDLRSHLVTSLKSAFESRLLHPGVNTADILTAYISGIKALRVLDPAGVILELVCDPVRRYLRSRDDTVRCIVSSLTDDGNNELLDELFKAQPTALDESCHSDDNEEMWVPDPVDAYPGSTSKSRRASDIIGMLVNIYGSKELFVKEYRTLLADRILTQYNYEIEKEIRYLELLKLRFGESELHSCEVMLKDVADSKRLNSRIAEGRQQNGEQTPEVDVNAMVLSAQFWPPFREEKITLPENIQSLLKKYTTEFEALKGNRTLVWKPHLGLVNIDIELKDRTLNFSVSPVYAAIIMQFQDKARWTVEELSNDLQMPATALRRKVAFWQSQGLLKEETTDTFLLVEEHKGRTQDIMVTDEDETESAMASASAQREEELQVYWSYIVGMITNLDNLPLERIHSMLRMFAMQGPASVECSIHELKAYLDRKVKEQKLVFCGGAYRLPKNN
ncbi:hypothetical protein ScPMuIL_010965 [Solemya velum]